MIKYHKYFMKPQKINLKRYLNLISTALFEIKLRTFEIFSRPIKFVTRMVSFARLQRLINCRGIGTLINPVRVRFRGHKLSNKSSNNGPAIVAGPASTHNSYDRTDCSSCQQTCSFFDYPN